MLKKNKNQEDELRESYDHITRADVGIEDEYSDEYRHAEQWSMNAVEKLRYEAFCKAHCDCLRDPATHLPRFGTIGGGIEVSFMGTGLGCLVRVKCLHCGHYADITDTSNW